MNYSTGSLSSQYEKLSTERLPVLQRARDCAKLTIPSLFVDEGFNSSSRLETPYNSIGARGVNNLSAALLLALLPPQDQPFFRLTLDNKALNELDGLDEIKSEIDSSLSRMERAVMKEIEIANFRPSLSEALKHLIVAGNCLLYLRPDNSLRMFNLNNYCIKRDASGNILKVITKETIAHTALPKETREIIEVHGKDNEQECDLYTCCYRDGDKYYIHQEIYGQLIPGSEGEFPLDKNPYMALRMHVVDGLDYGRSLVEEYFGDLMSIEALQKALVEGSAAAARCLFLVSPNGTTRARTIAEAPNGAIREGNATDVSVLQLGKFADFRIAFETVNKIQERLNYAFLLTTDTIRNAERVTAEEVRLVQQSIERQHSSVYSQLAATLQLPLVTRLLEQLTKSGKLPKLPKEYIAPMIITGVDALGRGQDLNRLDAFISGVGQIFGPEAISSYIDISEYLTRRAASLGIDPDGLVRTEEDIAAEQQQAQMAQMMQQAAPGVIQEGAKGMIAASQQTQTE